MTLKKLEALIGRLRAGTEQPRRVVVHADGTAVNPRRAAAVYGLHGAVCFVRTDGWTLSAPIALAGVAWAMYPKDWIAVVALPAVDPCRPCPG